MNKENKRIFNPVRNKFLSGVNGVNHKLFFKKIISAVFIILISSLIINMAKVPAQAEDAEKGSASSLLHEAGEAAKYDTSKIEGPDPEISIPTIAGGVIRMFLSLLGVIFIILTLYGGYLWMTARGNEEQITKAKDLIRDASIGLIIVIAAYAITYFVLYMIAREYLQSDVTGF